jgi:hypothetical protein
MHTDYRRPLNTFETTISARITSMNHDWQR